MSKTKTSPKSRSAAPVAPVPEPSEEAVRDYAYHLYEQGGSVPGRDVENWVEATACLKALTPARSSRGQLHSNLNGSLLASPVVAKRELAVLRRGREEMESEPTVADLDVRASLFDNRP